MHKPKNSQHRQTSKYSMTRNSSMHELVFANWMQPFEKRMDKTMKFEINRQPLSGNLSHCLSLNVYI